LPDVRRELSVGVRQWQNVMKLAQELSAEGGNTGKYDRMPSVTGETHCLMRTSGRLSGNKSGTAELSLRLLLSG